MLRPQARPDFLTEGFKEVVTAILALTILFVTVYMLVHTFNTASVAAADKDVFSREKDVLLYSLSLLGAVIGYYFGRVPAELHAQAAQKQATNAQNQLNQTQDKLTTATAAAAQAIEDKHTQKADFVQSLNAIRSNLVQPANAPAQVLRASPQGSGMAQALSEIDEMLKKLNS